MRPKDIEDGSFTKRTITSSDKLLEQLIGKKRAKVHLAAKQNATRLGAKPQQQRHDRSHAKKEESDDEEEGRTAAFKSKRRKTAIPKPASVAAEEEQGGDVVPAATNEKILNGKGEGHEETDHKQQVDDEDDHATLAGTGSKSIPNRSKPPATSFLDEILAERSKKKRTKGKTKATAET
tara:strand:+ start:991 stop:1527 length:537 start_codon:yes stop_codon:yes gene_type:complete